MLGLLKELKNFGRVRANAPLAKYTTFKIGGPAEWLVEVSDNDQLVALLNFVSGEGIPYFILGGGSNLLLPDEGLPGVVVRNLVSAARAEGDKLAASAGYSLGDWVNLSVAHSLTGLEWAAGIPGTVGGAVRGNAGARYATAQGELKDFIISVTAWRDGEVVELTAAECEFGYRDSIFKHGPDVVLAARIQLAPGRTADSLAITQQIIAERRAKQARAPSAGSFFKNVFLTEWKRDPAELPERFRQYQKIAAGWLIEQAGLKSYRVGGAQVSSEHANFIVNLGGATQTDVLAVAEEAQRRVYDKFGVALEPEVMVVRP
ncbi:MAG: UDP-N-acetylmuramate dehydrogenase [Candidatus Magasanikbacteria bacterium]|nr:UDP-N-acetylmuramate dehydrogenase [Candidatus Magasanikbacteria bacterium]